MCLHNIQKPGFGPGSCAVQSRSDARSVARQRVGAAAGGGAALGAGNAASGAAAGAAAAAGFGFFFFGRIALCPRGGGPAGCSSANTGLGSSVVVAGLVMSPGVRVTVTGTVAGWNFGMLKVTVKLASGAGIDTVQGVLQPGPIEVTASAPCGAESSCTCIGGGADLNESNENEEQPARLSPAAAITMIRRMIHTLLRQSATIPGPTIGASEQRCNRGRSVR